MVILFPLSCISTKKRDELEEWQEVVELAVKADDEPNKNKTQKMTYKTTEKLRL